MGDNSVMTPSLIPELERIVFELALQDEERSSRHVSYLVAQRVHEWYEPTKDIHPHFDLGGHKREVLQRSSAVSRKSLSLGIPNLQIREGQDKFEHEIMRRKHTELAGNSQKQ